MTKVAMGAATLVAPEEGVAEEIVVTAKRLPEAADAAASTGSQIDRAAFSTERRAYWKAEAQNNPSRYSPSDLARMQSGKAPLGADGRPMELHHVDGTPDGGVKPMTATDHRFGDNYRANHPWLFGD